MLYTFLSFGPSARRGTRHTTAGFFAAGVFGGIDPPRAMDQTATRARGRGGGRRPAAGIKRSMQQTQPVLESQPKTRRRGSAGAVGGGPGALPQMSEGGGFEDAMEQPPGIVSTGDNEREQWLLEGIEVDSLPFMDQKQFLSNTMNIDPTAEENEEGDIDLDGNDCVCKRCEREPLNEDIHFR